MRGKYTGGKRIGNHFYVCSGGLWIEILAMAQIEKEEKQYGPYN